MELTYTNKQTRTRLYSFIILAIMLFSAVLTVLTPLDENVLKFSNSGGVQIAQADNSAFDIVGNDGTVQKGSNDESTFSGVIKKYKSICTYILAIVTITMIIFMIIQFTKLGAAGDNQMARKQAIGGILTTGIATALLGSLTIWFGFFYHAVSEAK